VCAIKPNACLQVLGAFVFGSVLFPPDLLLCLFWRLLRKLLRGASEKGSPLWLLSMLLRYPKSAGELFLWKLRECYDIAQNVGRCVALPRVTNFG
jgi:hypothetical protein